MKPLSCLAIVLTFLIACNTHPGASLSLSESNLYSIDTVRMAAQNGNEKEARKALQEAMSHLKKGADTASIISLFKHAIYIEPSAKAYFELSGVLLATKQYPEAVQALGIAERLGYTPLANVMFRYAIAYDQMDNDHTRGSDKTLAMHYMELAIQMGYARPLQFLQKDLFPNMSRNFSFDDLYTTVLAGGPGINSEKSLWDAYAAQFPETGLPLSIDGKWIQDHPIDSKLDISFNYEKFIPEMRTAKFSREGGDNYYYIAQVHKDASFVALVYCIRDETEEASGTPLFMLATYDHQGKIIDRMAVAGRYDLTKNFLSFLIRPNLSFQVQEFKDVYKINPDSAGYDSTNVGRQDPLPPVDYHITAAGKLEKTGPALASR